MPAWWGTQQVEVGRAAVLRLGPLELRLERRELEWHVRSSRLGDVHHDAAEVTDEPVIDAPGGEIARFAGGDHTSVHLTPALADRPIVVRPETPISLIGGERTSVFVGTPLWVSVAIGDGKKPLAELPTWRPSDTWFGPNTREGQLCYHSRTSARVNLANLPRKPGRAYTEISVRNERGGPLRLHRFNVPVPLLSLHADADGVVWTDLLNVVETDDGTVVEIGQGPSRHAGPTTRLASARQSQRGFGVLRVIDRLLG